MPFTALKHFSFSAASRTVSSCAPPNAVYGIETRLVSPAELLSYPAVVRRLMPFTALKHANNSLSSVFTDEVVRRLMLFTALKLNCQVGYINETSCSCAPPNAVYGIETVHLRCWLPRHESKVVRRLMPFTALKRHKLRIFPIAPVKQLRAA